MSDYLPGSRSLLVDAHQHITRAQDLVSTKKVLAHEIDLANVHAAISQALTALAAEIVQLNIWEDENE